jgi:two-component system CheB/CheR fusion protein
MGQQRRKAKPRRGTRKEPRATTLVVGLGASAGGLEALEQFFSHVPTRSRLVFVVVQHLEPHHPSMLPELLARHTSQPVIEAADLAQAEPGRTYVIAPGTWLTIENGVFHVTRATGPRPAGPIDRFFSSLAEDAGVRAVGIVLSGAGHDGTAGLRAIKERGGLTLAQTPETARHESMPQGAIEAGLVDHVLPAERMPAVLVEHARFVATVGGGAADVEAELEGSLGRICSLLHQHTDHDFGRYKPGTLLRRIHRRMQVRHVESVDDYLRLLGKADGEPQALLKDLLIGVTQFFRDPEAFEALARQVVPRIVQGKAADAPVRIWVPGCASGEEAYSIAILVREHLERLETRRFVQIFATDLDVKALAEARQGRYPAEIAEHVSPSRLAQFFVPDGKGYQAGTDLREMCIFSEHSLIRDPPFSQLDLVSCRNVLIYLSADLQKRVVPLFHYALRPGGFLFLGPSEGIGNPELFEVLDKRNRIFRRKEPLTRPQVEFPLSGRSATRRPAVVPAPAQAAADRGTPTAREQIGAAFEQALREEFTSPSAVIDERGDALFVAGPISRYLQLPAGPVGTPNLLEAFRGGLGRELRAALQAARTGRRRIVRDNIQVEIEESARTVRLLVRPMAVGEPDERLFLVVVREEAAAPTAGEVGGESVDSGEPALEQLETELRTTRAELKATVEELESANEELNSSNEELISTNEELQSANEELQTSKEELQSLNEELETVNTELRQKVDELGTANSDLQNLFTATEVATVFLDRSLRVVKFTPAATALFRLIDADVGRPLSDLAPRFAGQDLDADAREVLRLLAPVERQIQAADGAWYTLRVLPYRTTDNVVAGVVITFVDVSGIMRAEQAARQQARLLHLSHDAILVWRLGGGIESWNRGAQELYGYNHQEAIGRVSYDLLGTVFPKPRAEIEAELRHGGCWVGEFQQRTKDGRSVTVLSNLQLVRGEDGVDRVLEANRDITERKAAERRLAYLASFPENNPNPLVEADFEGRVRYANPTARRLLPGLEAQGAAHPWLADWRSATRQLREAPAGTIVERRVVVGDRTFHQELYHIAGEGVVRTYGLDITARMRAEEDLRASEERFRTLAANAHDSIARFDRRGRYVYVNPFVERVLGRPAEAIVGRTVEELGRNVGTEPFEARLHEVFESGRPVRFDRQTVEGRWFDVQLIPEMSGADVSTVLTISRDITDRKLADEALRQSEERYRNIVETASEGLWLTDTSGLTMFVNQRMAEMLGYTPEEIMGRPVFEFMDEEAAALARTNLGRRQQGLRDRYEQKYVRKDGSTFWAMVGASPLRDRDGRIVASMGVLLDITERRAAEQALRAANEQLEEADRRKNEFLAVLSHELRNPLTPIRNGLYVLERAAPGSDSAKRAQEIIGRQTSQLMRLVDDLLDVTRVSRNKIQLQLRQLDLNDLVRRTLDDHHALFEDRKIDVETRIASERLAVSGDEARLTQVIGNLLQNAAKFTPAGGRVIVGTALIASRGAAVLRVIDTGVGIEPEMLRRLFQPFMQADVTLDRSKGGLGLGLALVRSLVQMHGGEVCAHSEGPGKGAEFVVELPLDTTAAAGVEAVPAASASRSRRVLIIEDNVDAAESLREVLELEGHEARIAYGGRDGLAAAREFRPDVVLCDIGLPGMDGFDVARAFRADEALKGIALVALSGYALQEDLQRAAEAGFERHLAKPADPDTLARLLADVLPATPGADPRAGGKDHGADGAD